MLLLSIIFPVAFFAIEAIVLGLAEESNKLRT